MVFINEFRISSRSRFTVNQSVLCNGYLVQIHGFVLFLTSSMMLQKLQVDSYLTSYQPVVTASAAHYTVGRCTLQCRGAPHPTPLFAHTRHTLVLLEKLACAVQHCEPVLLTGETGELLFVRSSVRASFARTMSQSHSPVPP